MKKIGKYLIGFCFLIFAYIAILTLTSLIPETAIREHTIQSAKQLQEGEKKFFDLKYKKEVLFRYTDILMINTAYSIDAKHPLESALLARKNYFPGRTTNQNEDSLYDLGLDSRYENVLGKTAPELYGFIVNQEDLTSYEYARYWHGYLAILRPLLVIANYNTILILSCMLCIGLLVTLLYLLAKKINLMTAVIYGVGFCAIHLLLVSFSINEIMVFDIAMIASIILLLRKEKIKLIGFFFFTIGSLTSFLDLLTQPIVTLGIPISIYFLLCYQEESHITKKEILKYIKIVILWGIGYFATWAMKWIFTDLMLGKNIIEESFKQILFRTGIEYDVPRKYGTIGLNLIDPFKRNIEMLSYPVIGTMAILGIAYMLILYQIAKREKINLFQITKEVTWIDLVPELFTFLLPIGWYIVLKNHSVEHYFFTYRILILCIIAIQIALCKKIGFYQISKKIEGGEKK